MPKTPRFGQHDVTHSYASCTRRLTTTIPSSQAYAVLFARCEWLEHTNQAASFFSVLFFSDVINKFRRSPWNDGIVVFSLIFITHKHISGVCVWSVRTNFVANHWKVTWTESPSEQQKAWCQQWKLSISDSHSDPLPCVMVSFFTLYAAHNRRAEEKFFSEGPCFDFHVRWRPIVAMHSHFFRCGAQI